MPPRAMWTGQLRLSLVSFGVRMYAATESAKKVSMNQLHKDCHQRLKNQTVCPIHGPVGRDEIVKGYAYEKDSYVIITAEDLEGIRLESTKTIDLVQFVDEAEIDPLYVNSPYYLGPDGPVAEEAFSVIREAMRRTGKVGIGRVVLQGREHMVAIRVTGKGFLLSTLRYASEVRSGELYFKDIRDVEIEEEQVELAETIMNSKAKPFAPGEFKDHYQDAFFEIVKAKIEGEEPVLVEEDASARTFNFMDALKESVAQAESASEPETATPGTKKKKAARKPAAKKADTKKPPAKSVVAARKKRAKKGA